MIYRLSVLAQRGYLGNVFGKLVCVDWDGVLSELGFLGFSLMGCDAPPVLSRSVWVVAAPWPPCCPHPGPLPPSGRGPGCCGRRGCGEWWGALFLAAVG